MSIQNIAMLKQKNAVIIHLCINKLDINVIVIICEL